MFIYIYVHKSDLRQNKQIDLTLFKFDVFARMVICTEISKLVHQMQLNGQETIASKMLKFYWNHSLKIAHTL